MDSTGSRIGANRIARHTARAAATAAIALMLIQTRLSAADAHPSARAHHHYKLVVMGTFGGPTSYFTDSPGNTQGMLNGAGTLTGMADTATPDPYAPDFTWGSGFVAHAFRWRDGATQDLGALPGVTSSSSTWISSNGLVAGVSENGRIDPLYAGMPESRAVLWENGQIRDLGTLGGGYESVAFAINSREQVVGASATAVPDAASMAPYVFWFWNVPYQYQTRAFLWDKVNGMQDLGTLGTGTNAQAFFVNERGQVAGISYVNTDPSPVCYGTTTGAFLWDKQIGMTNLGGLGGTCTLSTGLNDRAEVVGTSTTAGDQAFRPFLWDGSMHDLGGTLGGTVTQALAVNQKGEAVGLSNLPGDPGSHAVLWRHVGDFTDLGTVGNDPCSLAWAINDSTQVVGLSTPSDCAAYNVSRPFLWEHGSMVDLNSLIPPNSPLTLLYAFAINDRGEIPGNGVDADGNTHAFLLVPCDDDHPNLEGCDYGLVDPIASAPAPARKAATVGSQGRHTHVPDLRRFAPALGSPLR